jgi:hypothetical protein
MDVMNDSVATEREMLNEWVAGEMQTVDLGDKRRDEGLTRLLSSMAAMPSKSIPAAVNGGHNETTAAYRLFDNDSLDFVNILQPHIDASYRRVAEHDVVVLAQDTTELDLTRPTQQVEGAGPLDGNSRFGEFLHPLFAFTANGTPLGTLYAELWTRQSGPSKANDRKRLPIEEKESLRWLDTHKHAQEIAGDQPGTQFICVADSEADIFEVIECDKESPENFAWIIRSCYDRCLTEQGPNAPSHLHQQMLESPVLYSKQLFIRGRQPKFSCTKRARKQPRVSRECEVEVRATTVTLRDPYRSDRKLRPTTVNAILVQEVNAPGEDVPVSWLLLTNLPISTEAEIELVIQYYCIRWMIEIFFRTLKSGSRIEKRRFETIERFERCLAVSMIVAWRTFYATKIGRELPDVSCEAVFTEDEWQPVYKLVTDEDPPSEPPKLWQMVRLIARLGGYIDRCRDDEPGTDTVMRGMERLYDISACWRSFGPKSKLMTR